MDRGNDYHEASPHFDGEKEQIHVGTADGPEVGIVTNRKPTGVNKTKLKQQKELTQEVLEDQAIQEDSLT
ncbi:hypothetical protein ACJ2A9_09530 [Anaerobacillus sp. MEB173]|uniref:hypothetical protein n=1 Tax=Anaerobacillus sp. MEB173 TaxID=3383345 RepID=UPI003F9393A1